MFNKQNQSINSGAIILKKSHPKSIIKVFCYIDLGFEKNSIVVLQAMPIDEDRLLCEYVSKEDYEPLKVN